jgi:hypothetical protein
LAEDGFYYFLVSRTESAIKKQKFSSVCGRFKRFSDGSIDTSSYSELFWTWKLEKDELTKKSGILFNTLLKEGSIEKYTPERSEGYWVEFPGNGVTYNARSKKWEHHTVPESVPTH